ncbi:gene transfer agent family protein [Thioclava sp. GXIMD2076]|uniref:gene transfer agent family protein n=1 Tax=Thioclava sp. GXIMD2076 TaxID=3131931 RepID=UPI0030D3E8FD
MQPVVIPWPGGEHAFRLGISELETIQQKTDCGPEHLLLALNAGTWNITQLVHVIRCGLIGGGMAHVEALKLTRNAFDLHPIISFKVPCQEILSVALFGPPDDPAGEDLPVEPTPDS